MFLAFFDSMCGRKVKNQINTASLAVSSFNISDFVLIKKLYICFLSIFIIFYKITILLLKRQTLRPSKMNYFPFLSNYSFFNQENPYQNYDVYQKIEELTQLLNQKNQQIKTLKEQNDELKLNTLQLKQELENQSKKAKIIRKSTKNYYRKNSVGGPNGQSRLFCPYSNCHHHYSSILALNFHIKSKHNGGNKKQRQAYAKIIIQAEQKGQEAPKINFNFPPGFLERYKNSYLRQKKITDLNQKIMESSQ